MKASCWTWRSSAPSGSPARPGATRRRAQIAGAGCTLAQPAQNRTESALPPGDAQGKLREVHLPPFRPQLPAAGQRHHHHDSQARASGSGLGVAAIAGFSCAGRLSSLLMMPVYGFVQSIVFFIAQNTTAQQPDRVHTGLREGRRILFFAAAAWGGSALHRAERPAASALHHRRCCRRLRLHHAGL